MRQPALILAATAMLFSSSVYAIDIGLTLSEESEYTTNSGLTERDEVEEWIHSPGANLQVSHDGPALVLNVDYNYRRRIYQQDLFDDDNEAAGSANLVWSVLPERLDFTVNHTRTQSAIQSINAITPNNRQETINTTAGPLVRFNPRGQDEIQFEYLWGDRSSEDTDTDATTHNFSARYQLAMSPTNSLTLEAINNQVQYENRFIPDLDTLVGQLTWARNLSNVTYSLTGGYNRTERTNSRDDVDGFIFDVQVNWQARSTTTLTLTAARDIRDQSENLSSGTFADELDFSVNSNLGEVFTNERAGLAINQRLGGRTTLDLSVSYDEEDYEDIGRDTQTLAIRLGLNRRLTQQLSLTLGLSADTQEFDDQNDEIDTLRGDLFVDWALGRRTNVGIGVRYEERSSDSNLNGREYDEWVGMIRISYDAIATN